MTKMTALWGCLLCCPHLYILTAPDDCLAYVQQETAGQEGRGGGQEGREGGGKQSAGCFRLSGGCVLLSRGGPQILIINLKRKFE